MFGFSTIERWYYQARDAIDPVGALRNRVRCDRGHRFSLTNAHRRAIDAQYQAHPSWTKRLHYDNLETLVETDPRLTAFPSVITVSRYMTDAGFHRVKPRRGRDTAGMRRAQERLERREVRSYEVSHVGALWHTDFHHGKCKVLTASGVWVTPICLGVLDDRSRLACHVQWYLAEGTEEFVHGLCQAFQKRLLPRAILMDNGAAMTAQETKEGHHRLGILHETTLPYSPYQNAKKEVFWAQLEGRCVAMLEGVEDLTLRMLNEATQAWVELEYNRKVHSEIRATPLARFLEGPDVSRDCPASEALRLAFMRQEARTQRRSDGTVSIRSRRFEVPSRFRHMKRLTVRYASWDLSHVVLVDPVQGMQMARLYPQDKEANADGRRRTLEPMSRAPEPPREPGEMAPLMKKLLADYAATGLPFAYLPKDEDDFEEPESLVEVVR
jgi:transposase InsO family protein